MEGTPGPGYDLDDSASAYNGSGDAGAPAVNGEAQGQHAQNAQAGGSGSQKANNSTHIRSRITVVCAECKRLKLKCDRRTPCSSCTKRDTMTRCIYSQAAAEKIDVQSLHNRLLLVEGQVATLTAASAASNPSIPSFRSVYPSGASQSNMAGSSQNTAAQNTPRASTNSALGGIPCNDRYLLVSGPSGSSLVINLEDTSGIWLNELESQLGGIEDSSLSRTTSISPYSVARPAGSTNGSNKVKLEPTPVVLSTTPSAASTPSLGSRSSSKITNFGTISGFVAPLPYETFLASSLGDAPGTAQAYMSSFSSIPEYPTSSPSSAPAQFPQVTPALLRYFPCASVRARYLEALCEAMKVHPSINFRHFQKRVEAMIQWGDNNGESRSKSDLAREIFATGTGHPKPASGKERTQSLSPKPTLSFFSAAAVALALGSIMTRDSGEPISTAPDSIRRNSPAALFALSKQAMQLFEETNSYDIDSVIAMLLQVLFLMHDGQMRIAHMVFPLVGKMINVARMMGLAIDPDEFPGTYSLFEAETRRRIWWDIYYYDMVISDCMGHQSLITESSFTTRIPADVDEERFSPSSTTIPTPPEEGSNTSISYFILRCRLAQLVKSIRKQITRDILEESTESTVDQVASYEKEVMNFLAELPPAYRLNMDLDVTQPLEGDPVLLAQRSALCIIANRIVIKLYLPFMGDTSETSLAKTSHQAVLGTINAAHSIIYGSRVLYTVWRDTRPGIFEYYDYTRSLFDAAVICAQAVIQQPASILASEGMRGITHALDIMKVMTVPNADNSGVAADAIKMVEMMKEKAERARVGLNSPETATAGTKRKRSDGELHRVAMLTTGFTLPFVGPSVSSVKPSRNGPPLMMSKIASGGGRPESTATSGSEPRSSKSSRDKDKSKEKSKYPSVGIRVRTGNGQPPAVRQRMGSTPSLSPPTPGVAPPAHSQAQSQAQSQSSGSAVQTPVSDRSAGFTYPPPQAPPSAPHPMEAMQHDFQMSYSQSTSPESANMEGGQYQRNYGNSPQASSSLYDKQSPYATASHPPSESYPPPTPQEYYMPPYPPPPPAAYEQPGVDHSQNVNMATYPVNPPTVQPPLTSSVPSTPREPTRYLLGSDKSTPPYDPRIGKAELQRQMSHEYQHTATAHGMAITATQLSTPYVQGWQPELPRPDGAQWDYKFYSPNPS